MQDVAPTCDCGRDSSDMRWNDRGSGGRRYTCHRCHFEYLARLERHPNVFVSGALRCYHGGERVPPYRDIRQSSGRLTFSRYYRRLWLSGYDAAARDGYTGKTGATE